MSAVATIFLISVLGYLLGSIKIANLQLGTSGVLIVALIFGHFGFELPGIVRDMGLICFVTSVGFIAGPVFFSNFKKKALSYVVLGIVIVLAGAAICVAAIQLLGIPMPLAVGMFTGAMTSTPGLAAAMEATQDAAASIGYGIAYPFGVVGVVLFVQIIPKLFKSKSVAAKDAEAAVQQPGAQKHKMLEPFGFIAFGVAALLGSLLAAITVPLPGGASFNLGISGGPLIIGLIMGHFGQVGGYSLRVPKATLNVLREFGLMLFLMGAGVQAGTGFLATLQEYGVLLFLCGVVMTTAPMVVGFILAVRIFKIDVFSALSSICGGMTSTPALGALTVVAGNDEVAEGYAATYPVALICVVLASQFIAVLL